MILRLLFYILFGLFSFGQLARLSFFGQQINGYLYEFLMALILIILSTRYKLKPINGAFLRYRYTFWFFIFSLITFLFAITQFTWFENTVAVLYQLRLIFYLFFFYYLDYDRRGDKLMTENLRPAVKLFLWLTVLISLIQYFFYPDLRNLIYLGWDPHLYRIFGSYFDPYVAVVIYGLAFFYLLFNKRTFLDNLLLVLFFLFIFLTFSRIGYLAFILTFIFYLIKKRQFQKLILVMLIMILTILIIPKPQGEGVNLRRLFSIESRIIDYQNSYKIWKQFPLWGIGYNRIRYVKSESTFSHSGASFHSSFMIILVTTGIVGLLLFLAGFWQLVLSSDHSQLLLLYISLISLADNALLHPFILFLLLIFISLSRK